MKRRIPVVVLLLAAVLLLVLAAAGGLFFFRKVLSPTAPPEVKMPSLEAPVSPPAASGNCYWNWATQPLPELSEEVQAAVREIQAEAEAHAEAYGEDCIYEDGSKRFAAMETDYHVTLRVDDLADRAGMGGLIRKTMDLLLERFPTGSTPGPQPGRVTFLFRSAAEEKYMTVLFTQYQSLPPGLSDAELYEELSKPK